MQGYLNEEIRNVYKNFSEEDIHIKYSSLFYQFELLKDVILRTENKNIDRFRVCTYGERRGKYVV